MKEMTLRDLLADSRDGEWGKGEAGAGRVEMRVIRGTDFVDIRQGDFRDVPLRYLEQRHAERKRLQLDDILIETAGGTADRPTGRTALVTQRVIDSLGEDVTCASFARFLRINRDRAEPRFVFWLLQYHYAQGNLRQFHLQHTGVARFQFTTFADTFPLLLPSHEEQRRIASILGVYDDLIEVNRRRIALLEEMARRLFEEWFVHFRFPAHENHAVVKTPDGPAPNGWNYASLHQVAEVSYGFPFKSKLFNSEGDGVPVVRIRDIPNGHSSTWTGEPFDLRYAVNNGDLLIGMDGIFHTSVWSGGPATLNQRVARLRPLDGRSTRWLLLSVLPKIKHLEATISGTTVAHLSARDLNAMRVLVPSTQVQALADSLLAPIDSSLLNYRLQQRHLAASRDLLLPRLISGELSPFAAERELEAVA